MEEREKSRAQIAAYNAGIELARQMEVKDEEQVEEVELPFILPINGFKLNKSNLN